MPTGFSSAHHRGRVWSTMRRHAFTHAIPSTKSRGVFARVRARENSVHGGAASTPQTGRNGQTQVRTSCLGSVTRTTRYPASLYGSDHAPEPAHRSKTMRCAGAGSTRPGAARAGSTAPGRVLPAGAALPASARQRSHGPSARGPSWARSSSSCARSASVTRTEKTAPRLPSRLCLLIASWGSRPESNRPRCVRTRCGCYKRTWGRAWGAMLTASRASGVTPHEHQHRSLRQAGSARRRKKRHPNQTAHLARSYSRAEYEH